MYQEIWEAAVGEVLECDREPRNCTVRHAVTKKIHEINFRDWRHSRKYFNNENNPIYGIMLCQ